MYVRVCMCVCMCVLSLCLSSSTSSSFAVSKYSSRLAARLGASAIFNNPANFSHHNLSCSSRTFVTPADRSCVLETCPIHWAESDVAEMSMLCRLLDKWAGKLMSVITGSNLIVATCKSYVAKNSGLLMPCSFTTSIIACTTPNFFKYTCND